MTKKATDVLEELSADVKTLLGYVRNIDNNHKILLNQINQLSKKISEKSLSPAPPPLSNPTHPIVAKPPPKDMGPVLGDEGLFALEQASKDSKRNKKVSNEDKLEEEAIPKGNRRTARGKKSENNKSEIVIGQSITMDNGKIAFLANVQIFDSSGQLIKQTRTNTKGKWLASLEPGDYEVYVVKRVDNKTIENKYPITIPDDVEGPYELDAVEI